jgi:hypothetical protein
LIAVKTVKVKNGTYDQIKLKIFESGIKPNQR